MRAITVVIQALVAPLLIAAGAVSAGGDIHRCIESGRVVYTDRACAGQGEVLAVAGMVPVTNLSRDTVDSYVPSLPVTLGMSPRMVQDAMGRPYETVAMLEGRALVEYWVYRHHGEVTRVAFQHGRVTRISAR